jgi:hypothetical protein
MTRSAFPIASSPDVLAEEHARLARRQRERIAAESARRVGREQKANRALLDVGGQISASRSGVELLRERYEDAAAALATGDADEASIAAAEAALGRGEKALARLLAAQRSLRRQLGQ